MKNHDENEPVKKKKKIFLGFKSLQHALLVV